MPELLGNYSLIGLLLSYIFLQSSSSFSKFLTIALNFVSILESSHSLFHMVEGSHYEAGLTQPKGLSNPEILAIKKSYSTDFTFPSDSLSFEVRINENSSLCFSNNDLQMF
jgi:hypothetical protein